MRDVIQCREFYLVLAHPAWSLWKQPSVFWQVFAIDSDLDARVCCRPDHGELLVTPEADVTFFGCDIKAAQRGDQFHDGIVDGPKRGFLAGVNVSDDICCIGYSDVRC